MVARHREVGLAGCHPRICDLRHRVQGAGEAASQIRTGKFDRIPIDPEVMPARCQRAQRFVGIDDPPILAQQRDAVGQQIVNVAMDTVAVTESFIRAGKMRLIASA
jgi:hypothetical protein